MSVDPDKLRTLGVTDMHGVRAVSLVYQPGNGTRYELTFFAEPGERRVHMAFTNHRTCMLVPSWPEGPDPYYISEKLGVFPGDGIALKKLVDEVGPELFK